MFGTEEKKIIYNPIHGRIADCEFFHEKSRILNIDLRRRYESTFFSF